MTSKNLATTLAAVLVLSLAGGAAAHAAPPANDDFAAAQVLAGAFVSSTGTNVEATKEAGEPMHAANQGGASVWYRWTAEASGATTIDLCGSAFDTLLAVYTGTAVNSLTSVTFNDDGCGTARQSRVTFDAVGGTTYRIAVDGFHGGAGLATGQLHLSITGKVDNAAPAAPAISATTPASPSNVNNPLVRGTAEAGSTVRIFGPDCSGDPLATGTAEEFASDGLRVTVAENTVTSLTATATDASDNTSACSARSDYVEDSTPPAIRLTDGPPAKTGSRTATFSFVASEPVTFLCRTDYRPDEEVCTSPKTYENIPVGNRAFSVTPVDAAGNRGCCAVKQWEVLDVPPPAVPTVTATVPAAPANQNAPKVIGTAAAGSAVRIYANAACTGEPLAAGTAAEFLTGITVAVKDDTTTSLYAKASNLGGESACSTTFVQYVEDSLAPATKLRKARRTTTDRTPTFRFSNGATYQCRFDRGRFRKCRSPHTAPRLRPGRHTFEVRAIDAAGNVDPTPAKTRFRIVPKR